MKEFYETHKNIILPAILFIAVFLLFSRILNNDFVYDDKFLVVINKNIQNITNPVYYFTHGDALRPYDPGNLDIYRPLSVWFLAIEHMLFGMDSFYFHLVNLALHALNTLLFFFLLKKFIKNSALSFAGALLFGFHPVTTETVAWINQQTALWSWFFSFTVLIIAFSEPNRILNKTWKKILALIILSSASVFSKEQAVILPLIYLLCLFGKTSGVEEERSDGKTPDVEEKRRRNDKNLMGRVNLILKSKWKEFGAITFSAVLYILFRAIFLGSFVQQEPWGGGRYSMFLTMIKGFVYYFKLLFWPHPLSINYDAFPIARILTDNYVIFSILILALIIFMALAFLRRLPLFSLGIFWIFTVLLPVSNFILPTKQIINERFLYFALPGFIIVILGIASRDTQAINFEKLNLGRVKHSNILQNVRMFFGGRLNNIYHAELASFTIIILTVFAVFTYIRLGDWKNELTLWKHELAVSANSWRTQKNYAWALEMENQTKESINHYQSSLKLAHNPDLSLKSINALATAHVRAGEPQKAIKLIAIALKDFPENNALLYTLGQAYLENKQYDEAEKIFFNLSEKNNGEDAALFFAILSKKLVDRNDEEIKNDVTKIKNSRFREQAPLLIQGRKKMLEKKWPEAISLLIAGLKIVQPPIIEPYLWLAESYEKSGETEKALAVYDLTLSLNPLSVDAVQGINRLEQN